MDLIRQDKIEREDDPKRPLHPLLAAYSVGSEHLFLMDVIQKIRSR